MKWLISNQIWDYYLIKKKSDEQEANAKWILVTANIFKPILIQEIKRTHFIEVRHYKKCECNCGEWVPTWTIFR